MSRRGKQGSGDAEKSIRITEANISKQVCGLLKDDENVKKGVYNCLFSDNNENVKKAVRKCMFLGPVLWVVGALLVGFFLCYAFLTNFTFSPKEAVPEIIEYSTGVTIEPRESNL